MERDQRAFNWYCGLGRDRKVRKLTIAKLLCHRMSNEEGYFRDWGPKRVKEAVEEENRMWDQDLEMLGKILKKYARTWWT